MDDIVAYEMLKVDLGLIKPAESIEIYMKQLIDVAKAQIRTKGINLVADAIEDQQLVVMYAAWLYRKRDSGAGMPEMLRYALRNRQVSERLEAAT